MHQILKRIDVPPKNDDQSDESSQRETVIQSNEDNEEWLRDEDILLKK